MTVTMTKAPLEPPKVPDVLDMAADYIVTHGWTQGVEHDREGRVCAVGAINAVVRQFVDECASVGLIFTRTNEAVDKFSKFVPEGRITVWNDNVDRTAEEVINRFRFAAAKLRKPHWWSRTKNS